MYSVTTIRTKSGRIYGAHQKIDRIARKNLSILFGDDIFFPTIKEILHFEGLNGPDGIKRKSPGQDEPWHFIDPKKPDNALLGAISNHSRNLSKALQKADFTRASFEASWLAHAVTDGLTPAHHEPFEEELEKIRGEDMSSRNSISRKIIMPSSGSAKQFIKNNWEFWGAGGMMTTHLIFELGVASTIKPLKFEDSLPTKEDIKKLRQYGFKKIFLEDLATIDNLSMYQTFKKTGWTRKMAQTTRKVLVPLIIKDVTLAWLESYSRLEENVKD